MYPDKMSRWVRLNAQSVCPPQHWALSHKGRWKNGSTGPFQDETSDPRGDQDAEYAHAGHVSRRGQEATHLLSSGCGELTARCPQRGQTT